MAERCPGCIEAGESVWPYCHHSVAAWPLAEAMRDGISRLHQGDDWGTPTAMAFAFIDGAENVLDRVGPGPWTVEFTHPGGRYATVGLVNGRYLIGVEDGEGDKCIDFLGDLVDLIPIPPNSGASS